MYRGREKVTVTWAGTVAVQTQQVNREVHGFPVDCWFIAEEPLQASGANMHAGDIMAKHITKQVARV